MSFLSMELWRSYGHGHDRTSGGGMDSFPLMNKCECIGTVAEYFREIPWQDVSDFESILDAAGITEYARFICGYHIHGEAATQAYDGQYCALDWYFQSPADRMADPNEWQHFLILDQVCPINYHEARVVKTLDRYNGWTDLRIGA